MNASRTLAALSLTRCAQAEEPQRSSLKRLRHWIRINHFSPCCGPAFLSLGTPTFHQSPLKFATD
jgi:hypothetical protein